MFFSASLGDFDPNMNMTPSDQQVLSQLVAGFLQAIGSVSSPGLNTTTGSNCRDRQSGPGISLLCFNYYSGTIKSIDNFETSIEIQNVINNGWEEKVLHRA